LAISRLAETLDNRTNAGRRDAWLEHVPSASAYDAVATAKKNEEAARSESSAKAHHAMRADYLASCSRVDVDPTLVGAATAAHVASFYKFRTKNFKLGLSTSKHVSAQMMLYFKELGCSVIWSTGKVGDKDVYVNGNPNSSDDVAKCKRAQKAALVSHGRVPVPIDALEYGHMCAYYDYFIKDQDEVPPRHRCEFAAMMVATYNLLRFDEATEILYVQCVASILPIVPCGWRALHTSTWT